MKPLFITGIGTDVGKTIVSAILVENLKANYWKPIQAGDLNNSDTDKVKSLVSNKISIFHSESYRLTQPFSPHKSAELDNIQIDLNNIKLPEIQNKLIIEGAGGIMVPLNEKDLIIDLILKLKAEVILVSRNYLGSINHTLLSLEVLKAKNIPLKHLVFNGKEDKYSEDFIINYSGIKNIIRIPEIAALDKSTIAQIAVSLSI